MSTAARTATGNGFNASPARAIRAERRTTATTINQRMGTDPLAPVSSMRDSFWPTPEKGLPGHSYLGHALQHPTGEPCGNGISSTVSLVCSVLVEAAGVEPASSALPAPCPPSQVRPHDGLARNKNHAREKPVCFSTLFILLTDMSSGADPRNFTIFCSK
jgi:hypothetical protein